MDVQAADRRPRAVVCDDDGIARRVVRHLLDDSGYEVVGEAANAVEIIALVDHLAPQVVILDMALNGMSGMDAIPLLREAAPDTIVVVYSAFDDLRHHALSAGAHHVVDKLDTAQLGELLRKVGADLD
ncbi:MAG: cheY [Acidimicrobiales bacterium]|nr:cheY [Acidimicrobiales bacterium]